MRHYVIIIIGEEMEEKGTEKRITVKLVEREEI